MPSAAIDSRTSRAQGFAKVLEKGLAGYRGDLTVADAAVKSGASLREAEDALLWLSSEYRGHLKATDKGELLFSFPEGFEKRGDSAGGKVLRAIGRGVLGAGRFLVRAWVSVVMVGYAVVLLGVLIGMAFSSKSESNGRGLGDVAGGLLRVLAEALYWTFHPFSPVSLTGDSFWMQQRRAWRDPFEKRIPFYEKVNRFAFGPQKDKVDPREQIVGVVAETRRQLGRAGVGDVMKVTGLQQEEAEALLKRMVVDYEGEIAVSEEGAILYKFPALRLTAVEDAGGRAAAAEVAPIWSRRVKMEPLTGNSPETNFLLGGINAFNLMASGVVLGNDVTIERLWRLVEVLRATKPAAREAAMAAATAAGGVPIALGVVPFVFSGALFALPVARAFGRRRERRRVAAENGRRHLLEAILGTRAVTRAGAIPAGVLAAAWKVGAGVDVSEAQLTREVRALGGEPDVDDAGGMVYRFDALDREARSLVVERREAATLEARPGEVVFSSSE